MLDGRRAVVTGASRGIGAAVAAALDALGVRSVIVARNAESLSRVAAGLTHAVPFAVDLADARAAEQLARDAPAALGGAADILVNNAGAFAVAPLEETSDAALDAMLGVNLAAPFRLLRAFLPAMRTCPRAHVITIGSVADRAVFPGNAAYAASKFGARAMHEAVRAELRGTTVRATLVSPGPTDTPLWDAHDPDAREGFTPRRLMLRPAAVADAVAWALTRSDDVNIDELRLSRT